MFEEIENSMCQTQSDIHAAAENVERMKKLIEIEKAAGMYGKWFTEGPGAYIRHFALALWRDGSPAEKSRRSVST